MSNPVIKIEGLWKEYRLGVLSHGVLFRDIQSWWARTRGKPDPNVRMDVAAKQIAHNGERFWALQNIDLEIQQGDAVGIIGRNGAGKSTLLKILSRVTSPTKGEIRIKGRIGSLLEVGTGFHPELTGMENIFLNGAILGMRRHEIKCRLDEIIAFAEIEKFIDTPVKRYSSGMYVRLAFAVAAHLDPEILVVDEVLAVGDIAFQKKCLGKMSDVSRNQGRTVLFVSHNMGAIGQLCQKGVVLDKGKSVFCGKASESISYYMNLHRNDADAKEWNRTGSGRVRLMSAALFDSNGKESNLFGIFDSAILRLSGVSHINVEFIHSIQIVNGFGQPVIYSSDQVHSLSVCAEEAFTLELEIRRLNLMPGKYSIDVFLGVTGLEYLDFVRGALSFDVVQSDKVNITSPLSERYGLVIEDYPARKL